MPYTIAAEHFEFFLKNSFIELENLLPLDSLEEIAKLPLPQGDEKKAYLEGHDLIRKNPSLQKKLFTRNFVALIATLFAIKKPRLAFDQLLLSQHFKASHPPVSDLSFQDKCCIFKLKGVILIALTDIALEENPLRLFPTKRGNATFFKPEFRLSFESFFKKGVGLFLLIGIGDDKLIYTHTPADPFVHLLKKEDYVFGDLLKSTTHPYLKGF